MQIGTPAKEKIIVALDVDTEAAARKLVEELRESISFFKIGLELFTACGPSIIRAVRETGARVFLDLKFHDIPNTARGAVRAVAKLDVQMATIHLAGGAEMIRAAVEESAPANLTLLGVSVLTSMSAEALAQAGVADSLPDQVLRLARLGVENGMRAVVASPLEIRALRAAFGTELLIVTPGVRPASSAANDQQRTLTPREALDAGADYLVIGRPITAHKSPGEAAREILSEL